MARLDVDAPEDVYDIVRALGKRHDLNAPQAYGAALKFAENNQDDFEEFLEEFEGPGEQGDDDASDEADSGGSDPHEGVGALEDDLETIE